MALTLGCFAASENTPAYILRKKIRKYRVNRTGGPNSFSVPSL
jgi:hypothetical protein